MTIISESKQRTFGNKFQSLKSKKNDQSITQVEAGDKIITEPQFITEAFTDHACLILNILLLLILPIILNILALNFFNFPHICNTDVKQVISHLHSKKHVKSDGIPQFVIKKYTEIFTVLLYSMY
jgi:hypothetical protein